MDQPKLSLYEIAIRKAATLWVRGPSPGLLEEPQALLTTEPPLQPQQSLLKFNSIHRKEVVIRVLKPPFQYAFWKCVSQKCSGTHARCFSECGFWYLLEYPEALSLPSVRTSLFAGSYCPSVLLFALLQLTQS